MSKRVYEIARELSLGMDEVMRRLREAGVEVNNHFAVVEDPVYERVFGDGQSGRATGTVTPVEADSASTGRRRAVIDASATTTFEDEKVISLRDILYVLRRRAWLIGLVIIIALGTSAGLTLVQAPQYQASVKMLVGQESGFVGETGNVQQLEDLTQTMAHAVRTKPVAEKVVRQQGLNLTPEALLGQLSAVQTPNTQFIQVDYRDTDPERARVVAEAVGVAFSERVAEVSPDASAVTATVWEPAEMPRQPISPDMRRNIAIGLGIGAMLGVGLAFLLEYAVYGKRKGEYEGNES